MSSKVGHLPYMCIQDNELPIVTKSGSIVSSMNSNYRRDSHSIRTQEVFTAKGTSSVLNHTDVHLNLCICTFVFTIITFALKYFFRLNLSNTINAEFSYIESEESEILHFVIKIMDWLTLLLASKLVVGGELLCT